MSRCKGLCGHCKIVLTKQNCALVTLDSGYGFCRDCRNEASRLRYRRSPEIQKATTTRYLSTDENRKNQNKRVTAWHRKKIFGISQEEFDAKFVEQKGLCAICKQPMSSESRIRVPCQDHDHVFGKLRDLLCVSCNLLLGNCFENVEVLMSAIRYLQRHSKDN